jgi:S1-C subfamily serine protease
MPIFVLLLLAVGQSGHVESKDFSKDAQNAALRATVKVVNLTKNRDASAVIVKQEPKFVYFLTAAHAARAGDKLEIHTFTAESYPDSAEKYKSAEVIASDTERDIAVIRLATTDTMPGVLPLCPVKKVPDDKDFAALSTGCGGGKAPVCQVETVRRKVKVQRPGDKDSTLVWEIATAPANGRSGGPLVDQRGLVIGVASGANDGQGYYVHIDEIHRFLKKNALDRLYEEDRK